MQIKLSSKRFSVENNSILHIRYLGRSTCIVILYFENKINLKLGKNRRF